MMSKWISVEDEMPEIRQDVLIADSLKQVKAGYFSNDCLGVKYWHTAERRYCLNRGLTRVTHWMPLPDPPEVDDE
jgi:hypothetical protein